MLTHINGLVKIECGFESAASRVCGEYANASIRYVDELSSSASAASALWLLDLRLSQRFETGRYRASIYDRAPLLQVGGWSRSDRVLIGAGVRGTRRSVRSPLGTLDVTTPH